MGELEELEYTVYNLLAIVLARQLAVIRDTIAKWLRRQIRICEHFQVLSVSLWERRFESCWCRMEDELVFLLHSPESIFVNHQS